MPTAQPVSVRVFPYALVRYSPFDSMAIASARRPSLAAHARYIHHVDTQANAAVAIATATLHEQIGALQGRRERFPLLAIRRRLHKRQLLDDAHHRLLANYPSVTVACNEATELLRRQASASAKFSNKYDVALTKSLSAIYELSSPEPFRAALALASPSLFAATTGRRENNCSSVKPIRSAISLARYVYRAYTKTSPFSSFTMLSMAVLRQTTVGKHMVLLESAEGGQRISVNSLNFDLLWEGLISMPSIRSHVGCRVNPTICCTPTRVSWYVSVHNKDLLNNLKAPPPWMIAFLDRLADDRNSMLSPEEATTLLREVSPLTHSRAGEYVKRLLQTGLLVFEPPARPTDSDWLTQIEQWLQSVPEDTSQPILCTLSAIRSLTAHLAGADPDGRAAVIAEGEEKLSLLNRHQLGGVFWELDRSSLQQGNRRSMAAYQSRRFLRPVFYEDVRGSLALDVSLPRIERLCAVLHALAERCTLLAPHAVGRKALANFMSKRFGGESDIRFLALLDAVQAHRREVAAVHGASGWTLFDAKEVMGQQSRRLAAWTQKVAKSVLARASRKASDEPVALTLDDMDAANEHVGHWLPRDRPTSYSATLQVGMSAGGKAVWVMNDPTLWNGFGRVVSRFLPLFPDSVAKTFGAWNAAALGGENLLVENVDGSRFNGNIHPEIVAREIALPGTGVPTSSKRPVCISDLSIRRRGDDLALVDRKTERRVLICDVGFQTHGRSTVFELLNYFVTGGPIMFQALLEEINRQWKAATQAVAAGPRIVLEDEVVVQRSTWTVPPYVRDAASVATPSEWFRKVNEWRQTTGLPDQGFFRIPSAAADQSSRTFRKPQYLAFDDPVACELFRSAARSDEGVLQFVEMYPDLNMSPIGPGDIHHVTELGVTWYAP